MAPDAIDERTKLVRRVRLFHALAAVGVARHGSAAESRLGGSLAAGRHVFRLDGDTWASAWSPSAFVSVDADHERLAPGEDGADLLLGAPGSVAELLGSTRLEAGGRINAALWVERDGLELRGSTDRFELLTHAERMIFNDGPHCLRELFGLEATDLALAQRLEKLGIGANAELGADDIAALLGTKRRRASQATKNAQAAAELLGQIGVDWADPRGAARAHAAAAAAKETPSEQELRRVVEAITSNRTTDALGSIRSGAIDPSARAPDGSGHDGETLAMTAIKYRQHEVLEALIGAGAELDARDGGYTAIARAVEARDARSVRLLLAAGASLTAGMSGNESLLEFARYHTDVEIIRILLDAGAPPPTSKVARRLAEIATSSGAPELAARLAAT